MRESRLLLCWLSSIFSLIFGLTINFHCYVTERPPGATSFLPPTASYGWWSKKASTCCRATRRKSRPRQESSTWARSSTRATAGSASSGAVSFKVDIIVEEVLRNNLVLSFLSIQFFFSVRICVDNLIIFSNYVSIKLFLVY